MFSSTIGDVTTMAGTVGLAWTPGICLNNYRFSIVEDSGFISIGVS